LAIEYSDKKPLIVQKATQLKDVILEMDSRKRYHAVVLEEQKPWGILSIRDIAKAVFVEGEEGIELVESGNLGNILKNPCHYYASTPAITASRTISLEEAISIMVSNNIGSLPLIDDKGSLVGVLDERFLVKAIPDYTDLKPCDIASWDPISVEENEEILAAVGLMLSVGIRRILVRQQNNEIKGIVPLTAIVGYIVRDAVLHELLTGNRKPLEENVGKLSSPPWIIDCSYSLKEVASIISFDPTGSVLVKDDKRIGIITERDLLLAIEEEINR